MRNQGWIKSVIFNYGSIIFKFWVLALIKDISNLIRAYLIMFYLYFSKFTCYNRLPCIDDAFSLGILLRGNVSHRPNICLKSSSQIWLVGPINNPNYLFR